MHYHNPSHLSSLSKQDLSDNQARELGMRQLLTAYGLKDRFKTIQNKNAIFALQINTAETESQQTSIDESINKLTSALKLSQNYRRLNRLDMIISILEAADPTKNADTIAGITLLKTSNYDIQLDMSTGTICIELPTFAIANLYAHLEPSLVMTRERVVRLNFSHYLQQYSEALFLLDQGHENKPTLLLNSNRINLNQIFFTESKLRDDVIEVKSFMFAIKPTQSPEYWFILDKSGSMMDDNKLANLKQHVIKFAEALLTFDPAASIHLSVFDTQYSELGSFTQQTQQALINAIHLITPEGGTDITATAVELLKKIAADQKRHNVLLFTDGADLTTVREPMPVINHHLNALTAVQRARNKFFIISYEKQPEHLTHLTNAFESRLILHSTPDLKNALSDNDQLQNWAASREIFRTNVTIHSFVGQEHTSSEAHIFNQSDQLVLLKTLQARPGDDVVISVVDGEGNTVLEARKTILGVAPCNSIAPQSFFSNALKQATGALKDASPSCAIQ